MKKTLVSALTTALVVGAASTTFAAANPFEDVPADHWAYDAVAQLAKDGVVEGYGDGTYVGDAAITRYEMAQMVARAMAKSDLKHADKAMVDKLAAEFADELNNLGVRVAKLEKKVDNVKYDGIIRYTWKNARIDGDPTHSNTNDLRLRLSMHSEINDHWTGHARVEYVHNMSEARNVDSGIANGKNDAGDDTYNGQIFLNRLWVEGNYGNVNIQLGKLPYYTMVDDGMVFDDDLTGGQVTFGKDVQVKAMVGRYNPSGEDSMGIMGIEVYSKAQKFMWGVGYHNIQTGQEKDDKVNLWSAGLGYKFDKNWTLKGAYAQSDADCERSAYKKAYSVEVDYKGADMKKPGSWGAFVAYRHLGQAAALAPTYNSIFNKVKGWHLGTQIALMQNVLGYLEYFQGKTVDAGENKDDLKTRTLFGRVEMFF